ncbi:MAG: hypothetical protein ACRCWF_11945 [Beijerinckiaceae bacterium]
MKRLAVSQPFHLMCLSVSDAKAMTLISYLTKTHFADSAVEDALPEQVAGLSRIVVMSDGSPGTQEALARIHNALPRISFHEAPVFADAPSHRAAAELVVYLQKTDTRTVLVVGGSHIVAQARLAAAAIQRRRGICSVIAVPTALFDFGLSRHVRPRDGDPVVCPRPDHIIADPSVLAHTPTRRLAASGMEMLVHAIEAYARPTFNPPADGLALDAVRRLTRWLPVLATGAMSAALRRELMAAALTAGLAMEKGVGGVDALAHALEEDIADQATPGELHAPLMRAIIDFNARAVGERYDALLDAMGGNADPQQDLPSRLATLSRMLKLPVALRETATDRSAFARIADIAADDPSALANPRLMTSGDCRQILEAAW